MIALLHCIVSHFRRVWRWVVWEDTRATLNLEHPVVVPYSVLPFSDHHLMLDSSSWQFYHTFWVISMFSSRADVGDQRNTKHLAPEMLMYRLSKRRY